MVYEIKGTEGLTSDEKRTFMKSFLRALIKDAPSEMALLANVSALIMALTPDLNWAGFYLASGESLLLGPFQGLPACMVIGPGEGVCGQAFLEERVIRVEDVHVFPGHIACDSASESELVVPIRRAGEVFGVLDLDSPLKGRFGQEDEYFFIELMGELEKFFH